MVSLSSSPYSESLDIILAALTKQINFHFSNILEVLPKWIVSVFKMVTCQEVSSKWIASSSWWWINFCLIVLHSLQCFLLLLGEPLLLTVKQKSLTRNRLIRKLLPKSLNLILMDNSKRYLRSLRRSKEVHQPTRCTGRSSGVPAKLQCRDYKMLSSATNMLL